MPQRGRSFDEDTKLDVVGLADNIYETFVKSQTRERIFQLENDSRKYTWSLDV